MHLPLKIKSKSKSNSKNYLAFGLLLSLMLISITILTSLVILKSKSYILGSSTSTLTTAQIISLINLQRKEQQLPPLQVNSMLNQAAESKLQDMITNQYFSHKSPAKNPWQFISDQGYIYQHAGENLARDFYDNQSLVEAWMQSPGHRSNILNPNYTQTGVAISTSSAQPIIVQLFATPLVLPSQTNPLLDQFAIFITFVFSYRYQFLFSIFAVILILLLTRLVLTRNAKRTKNPIKNHFWHH